MTRSIISADGRTYHRFSLPGAKRHHYVDPNGITGLRRNYVLGTEERLFASNALCGLFESEWYDAPEESDPCITCHAIACTRTRRGAQ